LTPLVAVEGLTVRYPGALSPALDDVSFTAGAGEVVGVVGMTGAGRSTLLRALRGIVPRLVPAEVTGSVRVAGLDPRTTPVADLARLVSIVIDDPEAQLTQLTVGEEVAFGLENLGTPPGEMRERVGRILEAAGLAPFEDRNPLSLSGGEQQRLAVACALVVRPRLLLLDEPVANLDPRSGRAVLGLATALAREAGSAVLVATNDVDLLASYAVRVLVLADGRVVADDEAGRAWAQVARHPGWIVPPAIAAIAARLEPDAEWLPSTVGGATHWLDGER
jgi:energy-coupling factor transporter ATP-binding protein EcfA2